MRNNVQSYADMVARGGSKKDSGLIVKAEEYGNGWLHGSLVSKLKPLYLVSEFKQELFKNSSTSVTHLRDEISVNANTGDEHCVDNGEILKKEDDDVTINDEVAIERNLGDDMCLVDSLKESSRLEAEGTSRAPEVRRCHLPAKKIPKKAKRKTHIKAIGGTRFNKGVLLRAATQALSDSISLNSNSSRGRYLLNEAQATLQIGKVLGVNCEGNENEVIEKIMELKNQDLESTKQLDAAKQS
ncbi:hypothetical protein LOK49_LG13G00043 [Camellia lanceoleosa]|uniref:Uncharacterized protein n=1 Tax=Camellia lanceoleosa TaxID=1840588 RepID=A0ACC0FIA1_9ERIC|nr:hypothetical protein LOK49_LG13G00043 [Camellia lanceoleosa]